MASYEEARAKLTNTQLSKLRSVSKNHTGTTLRITKENFQDEKLPHELFFSTRQKTKITNALANNMSTDIKLNKVKFSKMIQLGGFLATTLDNLGKKVLHKFEEKVNGQGAVREGKGFTLFISDEVMDDIIKIVDSLEKSGILIDGATETGKHEKKKKTRR